MLKGKRKMKNLVVVFAAAAVACSAFADAAKADPKKDPTAVKFDSLSYDEVLERHLAVMDSTATCLAMDNHIPVLVFALKDPENIRRAARGENVGTLVK